MNRGAVWNPDEFVLSFWCGPPEPFTTLERYREIKFAGFTHVMPPCAATTPALNRKILDLCVRVGLKAFVGDPRMPLRIEQEPDAKARLDAIVADYAGHPALAGYHLTDEPNAGAFPGLAQVVAYLRERDPRHHTYINLFPNYAEANRLGTPTYPEHLRRYMETVRPFVLSYDHYHFFQDGGERAEFFANLADVRRAANAHDTHFWNIVLATQHFGYRNLNEAELRYEAMQTLAYGGKGLLWFTYWMPGGVDPSWKEPMISGSGERTPHYYQVRRVNREVAAFGRELLRADSLHVFHTGTPMPAGAAAPPPDAPLTVSGPGRLTVGVFRAPTRHTLAFVANVDYRNGVTTQVKTAARSPRERFDPQSGRWTLLPDGETVALTLAPAAAALLRWEG